MHAWDRSFAANSLFLSEIWDLVCIDALHKGMKFPPLAVLRTLGSQYLVWCQIFDYLRIKGSVCWFTIWVLKTQIINQQTEPLIFCKLQYLKKQVNQWPGLICSLIYRICLLSGYSRLMDGYRLCRSTSQLQHVDLKSRYRATMLSLFILFIWLANGLQTFRYNTWFNGGT